MNPDPNDPAAVADARRRAQEADPKPDRPAGQEADRIETMQDNLRRDYGRDRDPEDLDRAPDGRPTTASEIAERNGERDR